jgi:epoxide hydrolase-like predicted phosphatase
MVRAIVFDCFGVLTADSWHEFRQSLPHAQQSIASETNRKYCAGELDKQSFVNAISGLTGYSSDYIEQLVDHESEKNKPLLTYIEFLGQTYKIGLLSNVASNWISDHFLTPDEQGYFDAMVLSFKIGLTKPDPRVYEVTCERLGVSPNETVMIDDIDRYVEAAKNIGMQGIVYRNLNQLKRDLTNCLNTDKP